MSETQKSCSDWASESFGQPGTLLSVVTRANEELAELIFELEKDRRSTKARAECADVTIILYRLAERCSLEMKTDVTLGAAIAGWTLHQTDDDAPLSAALFAARHMLLLMENMLGPNPDWHFVADRLNSIGSMMAFCAFLLGTTLPIEVDRKMEINRRRVWRLTGNGHGYHIKGPRKCAADVNGRDCVYSRSMNQPTPRICTRCGEAEPPKE